MTKIPLLPLSLIMLGWLCSGLAKENIGQTYILKKNTPVRIPLFSDTRLLPACPPDPVAPGGSLVITQNTSLSGAFYPNASAANALVPPPQTVGVNFIGADQGMSASWPETPPNPMGAVGPQQFLVATESTLTSFTKSGLLDNMLDVEPAAFANLDGNFSIFANMTEPRIAYDPFSQRWYYLFINFDPRGSKTNNGFTLAVSDSGIISNQTKWTVLTVFNATQLPDSIGCAGDQEFNLSYASLGIDQNAIYTSLNATADNGGGSTTAIVIQKQSLLTDGPVYMSVFRDVSGLTANPMPYRATASSLVGVTNFDLNPTFGYYIATDPLYFGRLTLYRVSNPGSKTPTLSGPIPFNVLPTGSLIDPSNTPFLGNLFGALGTLDHFDDRLSSATIRNGQLYTCHTILVNINGIGTPGGDRAGARWYQISTAGTAATETDTTVPTLVQAGTLWDATPSNPVWYTNASCITNARGEFVLAGSASGNDVPASCYFVGRLPTDPLGILRIGNPPPNIYALGAGSYSRELAEGSGANGQPWGKYSLCSVDPTDNLTIWTVQERLFQSLEQVIVTQLLAP